MKKIAVLFLAALALTCFARPAWADEHDIKCQELGGQWVLNYNGTGSSGANGKLTIPFTVLVDDAAGNGDGIVCKTYGKREWDNKSIIIQQKLVDKASDTYYYYEAPTGTTPGAYSAVFTRQADADPNYYSYMAAQYIYPDFVTPSTNTAGLVEGDTYDWRCQAFQGRWIFDYGDNTSKTPNGKQAVIIDEVCHIGMGAAAMKTCMEKYGGTYYGSVECDAHGRRISDNKPINFYHIWWMSYFGAYGDGQYSMQEDLFADQTAPQMVTRPTVINGFPTEYPPDVPYPDNVFHLVKATKVDYDCIDRDNDLYGVNCDAGPDCNDSNKDLNPGKAELCDGIDQNCNGQIDEGSNIYYRDEDGDTYGNPLLSIGSVCDSSHIPSGYVNNSSDCNDGVDGFDSTLPGTTYYQDFDRDTQGNPAMSIRACAPSGNYDVTNSNDCDDTNAAVKKGATEVCNSIDDDCDGVTDEGFLYDGAARYAPCIGIGECGAGTVVCAELNTATCSTNPNGTASQAVAETCNTKDDDCDGSTDEEFNVGGACKNGLGICERSGNKVCSGGVAVCDAVPGLPNPGGEIDCNGYDDDCDGDADEGSAGTTITFYRDDDNDTYGNAALTVLGKDICGVEGYKATSGDCDDSNAAIHPGAQELCNGIDDNCDGTIDTDNTSLPQHIFYQDKDNDTYGNKEITIQACAAPPGYTDNNSDINPEGVFDCKDNNSAINPGEAELCNSIDDNCNGQTDEGSNIYYRDEDGDTYGNPLLSIGSACTPAPAKYAANSLDCNDNSYDNTLPGTVYYQDFDRDTQGNPAKSIRACAPSGNYDVTNSNDCDDTNAAVKKGATEVCNGIDDNCNGSTDEGVKTTYYQDLDNDGHGTTVQTKLGCTAPVGYAATSDDCNDSSDKVKPGATEVCNDIDDNCNGQTDEGVKTAYYLDADGDTYGTGAASLSCTAPTGYATSSGDCNDGNAAINPGAKENCTNSIDDNCDGSTDGCAPGECGYWRGKWEFTYKDTAGATSTDNVNITDICVNLTGPYTDEGKPACMTNAFFTCAAKGTRASNGQQIIVGQAFMEQRLYAYYETWTPGSTTPWDAVYYRDPTDPAAFLADPFHYKGGYNSIIPGKINSCDFVAATDGSFTAATFSGSGPYKNTFGLVDGRRLDDPACDNVTDKCIDKDKDGYGDNCTLGPDCNDNDASVHPGAKEVCNGKDDDCNGKVDDNETCGVIPEGDCILKVVPKQIVKLFSFLNPFMPFVISAASDSGVVFARPFDIDWGTDAIKTLLRSKIGNRAIVGFMFVRPFKLDSDNYTVVVNYGDNETECGKIEVK